MPTVGIMSPGDMGHAVGAVLAANGVRVLAALDGRSERTRALAAKAGIEDVGDERALVRAADLLLSILVPAEALALAERVAAAVRATGADLLFVDCNAIAPATTGQIGAIVTAAGARFVDAGIIGPPPTAGSANTRFYASGSDAGAFAQLGAYGLDVRVVGDRVGDASAVKMCYAALTKGTTAVMTQLAIAAERLGISAALHEEFAISQVDMRARMARAVPAMVPKAHRWVGEMEEIARTFGAVGVTPKGFEGAAEIYATVADNPQAKLSPEAWRERKASFEEVVTELSRDRPDN